MPPYLKPMGMIAPSIHRRVKIFYRSEIGLIHELTFVDISVFEPRNLIRSSRSHVSGSISYLAFRLGNFGDSGGFDDVGPLGSAIALDSGVDRLVRTSAAGVGPRLVLQDHVRRRIRGAIPDLLSPARPGRGGAIGDRFHDRHPPDRQLHVFQFPHDRPVSLCDR